MVAVSFLLFSSLLFFLRFIFDNVFYCLTINIILSFTENLVKELEENLQSIREINGYLKIVRSFPLVSLNFLKNLKVIHGKKLDSDKYVYFTFSLENF